MSEKISHPLASGFERLGILVEVPSGAVHKYPTESELCIVNLKTGKIRLDVESEPFDHEEYRAFDLNFYVAWPSTDLSHLVICRRDIVKNSVSFDAVTGLFTMEYNEERIEANYRPGGWTNVRSYNSEL